MARTFQSPSATGTNAAYALPFWRLCGRMASLVPCPSRRRHFRPSCLGVMSLASPRPALARPWRMCCQLCDTSRTRHPWHKEMVLLPSSWLQPGSLYNRYIRFAPGIVLSSSVLTCQSCLLHFPARIPLLCQSQHHDVNRSPCPAHHDDHKDAFSGSICFIHLELHHVSAELLKHLHHWILSHSTLSRHDSKNTARI